MGGRGGEGNRQETEAEAKGPTERKSHVRRVKPPDYVLGTDRARVRRWWSLNSKSTNDSEGL